MSALHWTTLPRSAVMELILMLLPYCYYYLDFPFSMENRENSLFLITSGTSIKGSEFAKENILIKLHFNLSLQTDY